MPGIWWRWRWFYQKFYCNTLTKSTTGLSPDKESQRVRTWDWIESKRRRMMTATTTGPIKTNSNNVNRSLRGRWKRADHNQSIDRWDDRWWGRKKRDASCGLLASLVSKFVRRQPLWRWGDRHSVVRVTVFLWLFSAQLIVVDNTQSSPRVEGIDSADQIRSDPVSPLLCLLDFILSSREI